MNANVKPERQDPRKNAEANMLIALSLVNRFVKAVERIALAMQAAELRANPDFEAQLEAAYKRTQPTAAAQKPENVMGEMHQTKHSFDVQ